MLKALLNQLSVFALLVISSLLLTSCSSFKSQGQYNRPGFNSTGRGTKSIDIKLIKPIKRYRISRGFSPAKLSHYGVDFVAPKGTSVYASHNAKVIFAGRGFRGYGNLVVLEHPDGITSFYAHLNSILVSQGQLVDIGHRIGSVGNTGNARGVHLHFELKLNGKAVDPMLYLR